MIELSLFTVKVVAAVEPNMTAVAPVNPLPVIDTDVPPSVDPEVGLTPVTEGTAAAAVVVVVGASVVVVVGASVVVVVGASVVVVVAPVVVVVVAPVVVVVPPVVVVVAPVAAASCCPPGCGLAGAGGRTGGGGGGKSLGPEEDRGDGPLTEGVADGDHAGVTGRLLRRGRRTRVVGRVGRTDTARGAAFDHRGGCHTCLRAGGNALRRWPRRSCDQRKGRRAERPRLRRGDDHDLGAADRHVVAE